MSPASELDGLLQQQLSGAITPDEFAACSRALYSRYADLPLFGRELGNWMRPEVIEGTVTGLVAESRRMRVTLNGRTVLLSAESAGRGAIRLGDRLLVATCSGPAEETPALFYFNETSGYGDLAEVARDGKKGRSFARACLGLALLIAGGSGYRLYLGGLDAVGWLALLMLPLALFFALLGSFLRAFEPISLFSLYVLRSRMAERAPR